MSRNETQLMSIAEVAVRLRVSPRTLADWRVGGSGPPWIKVGKAVLYPAAALRSWLASREASAAA